MVVPRLTRKIIAEAPLSTRHPYYIMERGGRGSIPGFGLRVHRTRKDYIVRWRNRVHRIARVELLSLEKARAAARELLLGFDQGKLPAAARGASRTIADLHQAFMSGRVELRNRPRTVAEYKRLWDLHLLPRFGTLRLSEVTPEKVLAMKAAMKGRPVAANRALQQLDAAFRFAIRTLGWTETNPASVAVIERFQERPSEHRISTEQYRALGKALRKAAHERTLSPSALAAIWAVLLTGARPGEILGARLEDCELSGPAPRIRVRQAKGDRPGRRRRQGRTIWLPQEAAEILRAVPRQDSPWLIPGKGGEPQKSIDKAWARICRMAGISGLPPKAARHAYTSEGPEVGVPAEVMSELLGHRSMEITHEVYRHAKDEGQAAAASRMGAHIAGLMGGEGEE